MLTLAPPLSVWSAGLCAFLLFPALLAVIPAAEPTRRTAAACEWAGRLSYPVYLLHTPVLLWCGGVAKLWLKRDPETLGSGYALLLVAVTIGLSWAALRWVDEPMRRRLAARLLRPRTPAAVMSASATARA